MKTLNYLLISIILCLSSSCNLDRFPLVEYAEEKFWTNEENAELALTAIYRARIYPGVEYSPSDWWSYGGLVLLELASDNGYDRRGNSSGFHQMTNGTLLSNNGFVNSYWSNSYAKIARCNRFLEGIENLDRSEKSERLKAEARFLRASQYFYLSQYFGNVPLVLSTLTPDEANNVKKETKENIIQFCITEFSESANYLPRFKDLKESEQGRACKQASLAFLGRTLLAEKKFKEAAEVYQEIINLGDNAIDPDYESIFLQANENSSENIFSMQYIQDLFGSGFPQHALPVQNGGWCLVNATASLFEAYRFTNGEKFDYENPLYDPNNLGKNRDPRLSYTLLYNGTKFGEAAWICHPDIDSPDKIMNGQTTQTGFLIKKYMDPNFKGNVNSYGANIPIIRYAEVLLSYLEAKIENGDPITQDLLDLTINQLRLRKSVNMPPVTETNRDSLREILRNERQVELAMEGIRYWDLLRWGIAHEKLNGEVFGSPFPGSHRVNLKPDGTLDKYGRWYVCTRDFRKDKDYQWPIPQSEQNINPNLR